MNILKGYIIAIIIFIIVDMGFIYNIKDLFNYNDWYISFLVTVFIIICNITLIKHIIDTINRK